MNDEMLVGLLEERDKLYIGMTKNEEEIKQLIAAKENAFKMIRELDKKILMSLRKKP